MNVAASRSVRPGVIVRTCSVIASRTFTAPSDRLRVASSSRAGRDGATIRNSCPLLRAGARRAPTSGADPAWSGGGRFRRIVAATVHIRAAERPDVPAVLALWARARSAAAVTPDTTEAVERLLATLPGSLLVAEHGPQAALVGALVAA
jgi:hypothetical protein